VTRRDVAVLAHRGASRAERENTIAAFRRAASMGAHAVELDVRRTRDGALVVHHDASIDDGRVICEVDAHALPAHIPSLEAALAACGGMWVNIEIKNHPGEPDFDPDDEVAERTMELLLARGEPERWLISGFRAETVDRCRAIADAASVAIRTAWLTAVVPPGAAAALAAKGHSALHPWVATLSRDDVAVCHAHGLAVNTWTCDDPDRMRELIAWGVDGICTNVPDVALTVVAQERRRAR
jgi:glycerophosphoryl diester phosphodiesterase